MSKIEDVRFYDSRGNEYIFQAYPRRAAFENVFENVAGVYAFTRRSANQHKKQHKVFYIGETDALKRRLGNHEKWYEAIERGINITHICLLVVKGQESIRRSIEKRLIFNYKPQLNCHYKRG